MTSENAHHHTQNTISLNATPSLSVVLYYLRESRRRLRFCVPCAAMPDSDVQTDVALQPLSLRGQRRSRSPRLDITNQARKSSHDQELAGDFQEKWPLVLLIIPVSVGNFESTVQVESGRSI
jgi:hypothetical protein